MKIYRVLVSSVGGQGGGTITEILFNAVVIERRRFANADIASRTDLEYRYMVPGLAQRNGSVYSVVIFVSPHERDLPDSNFIFAERLYTASTDLLIAQELSEAVRFASMGLLKCDATAIVNEHRFFTSVEKMPVSKDLVSNDEQINSVKKIVGTYIGINAHEVALVNGMKPVYANTILLGVLCASNILPISKESFMQAITQRFSGKARDENIKAFELGYKSLVSVREGKNGSITYHGIQEIIDRNYRRIKRRKVADKYMELMEMIPTLPSNISTVFAEAVGQLIEFEGLHHALKYVAYVKEIIDLDRKYGDNSFKLTQSYAMHLAGRLMKWEGPFEVARIKCKRAYKSDGVLKVEALLQPNTEEMYGMIPKRLHDLICRVIPSWQEYIEKRRYDGKPISIDMTNVSGYLKLWLLWKLSFMQKYSVRYHREMEFVRHYTDIVKEITKIDYELGYMVADYAQYIRGFAHVRARNIDAFNTLIDILRRAIEMDKVIGNYDYKISRSIFRAARNMITLDGSGKDRAMDLMKEVETLFNAKDYERLYIKLALRELTPLQR